VEDEKISEEEWEQVRKEQIEFDALEGIYDRLEDLPE